MSSPYMESEVRLGSAFMLHLFHYSLPDSVMLIVLEFHAGKQQFVAADQPGVIVAAGTA